MSSSDGEPVLADKGAQQNDVLESEDELGRDESHGDEDLSDDDRPGRFYGPDSSWRFYTQGERALAASLDQAENNDLSIHLYNAHAWKLQHRDVQRMIQAKPWHSKQRWVRPDDEGKLPFLPSPAWTAWPLRPEDVPRSTEQWGIPVTSVDDDTDTIRAGRSWNPSLHLQEEIQATLLRLAKERFYERDWTNEGPNEDVEVERPSRSRRTSSVKPEDDSDEPLDDLERLDEQLQQTSSPVSTEITDHYLPTVPDDDDAANRILQPSVRHILVKLDHLLIALHKSRQGHTKERSGSRSRSRGSRSCSKSRARPQRRADAARKRKRVASDDAKQLEEEEEDDNDDEIKDLANDDVAGADVSRRNQSKYTLGTRDWSEVLGIASLAGFDQAVIDRTARRCATLFREGMTMRTIPQGIPSTAHDETTSYMPDMIPPISSESDGSVESSDEANQIYSCPHTTCARHDRPYEQQWRLNEHLKRTHKNSGAQLAPVAVKPLSSSREASADGLVRDDGSSTSAEGDTDEDERMVDAASIGQNGFLQPISVHIGRSRDRRARKARSGSARTRRRSTQSTGRSSDAA